MQMTLHALALACGIVVAQADLPNANLPGNSPTLPSSNLPGPVTTDQPIVLPNTDSSGSAVIEARQLRAAEEHQAQQTALQQQQLALQQQTAQLAAKAAEEASRARAEAAEAKQTLQNAVEQRQP
jgi:hypothetical protein